MYVITVGTTRSNTRFYKLRNAKHDPIEVAFSTRYFLTQK